MPIEYKTDILALLKKNGYSTYRLRKERLIPESTIQKFRENKLVTLETIATVCRLCHCEPGNILTFRPEDEGQQD